VQSPTTTTRWLTTVGNLLLAWYQINEVAVCIVWLLPDVFEQQHFGIYEPGELYP